MGRLSTTVVSAAFVAPDDMEPPSDLIDYELGGVGLSDSSEGLRVKTWTSRFDTALGAVMISAPDVAETVLFTAPGVSELSFTFDQNMRPFHAFVQNGRPKIRWYDSLAGGNRIDELDADVVNPRCCLDDKRSRQTTVGTNDIILAYLRGGNLYYRQQRDRFEVERLLKTGVSGKLKRVGMNALHRLQFLFEGTP